MKRLFMTTLSVASLMAGSAAAQQAAQAQPEGEEIIVTAQKRSEALEDVPVSISVLTADALETSGVTNAVALNNMAPGLRVSSADAASSPKIFIRGVGLSDFNPNASGAVGIYVDGVYIGSPLAQLAGFYDLAQVEVLRGPQGTLYGRNTNGGAINITANRPTFDFVSNARVEYAESNAVTFQGGVGGPIIDDLLAFRIAGQWVSSDGHTYDRVIGDDVNALRYFGGRAALLFTPTPDLSIYANIHHFENHGDATAPQHRALFPATPAVAGPDGYCLPSAYASGLCTDLLGYADTDNDVRAGDYGPDSGRDTVYVRGGQVQLDWRLGDIDLVAISAYQSADRDAYENTDVSPINMLEIHYNSHSHAFTQELRVQSNDPAAPLRWVAGVFYMDETIEDNSTQDVLRALRAPTVGNPLGIDPMNNIAVYGYPYTQQTESLAVFGQADYNLTERLIGTFGLRWSEDTRDFDYRSEIEFGLIPILNYRAEESFAAWSGRLGLRYELTPDSNVYATYSRGFKSGGFFGGLATTFDQLEPYDNEQLDAYEIGFKGLFFDRALRLSTSAFYYDYQDQQVFALALRSGVTTLILNNAGSSTAYGGEVEASWRPTDNFDIQAGVSLLHAEFDEFISEGQDYGGNRLPQAPELTFNASMSYAAPLPTGDEIVLNADTTYSSKIYFDNSNAERLSQGAVWNMNGQVSWRSGRSGLEAGVFARNLFDEDWIVAVSPIESLGVDLLTYNRPRSVGVFVRFSN
ncbi:MAG: TonB-dependent receptor [Hyphomonadaceae bacterium]|nr:TonB-dependent receptor [Hyphomonadaceae bacterium]